MIAIIVWILELLLMGTLAHIWPDALVYDTMLGGMAYAVLAWIPALMMEGLWK